MLLFNDNLENFGVPIYSPANLERLINLGRITTAKKILFALEEFHKTIKLSEISQDDLTSKLYQKNHIDLEVPMPSIKNLLNDDESFTLDKRRASFYDEIPLEQPVDNNMLKLDFDSSEDEEMPYEKGQLTSELTGMFHRNYDREIWYKNDQI